MIRNILLSLLILIAVTSVVHAEESTFKERKANLAEVSAIRVGYGAGTVRLVVDMTKKVEFVESYAENPSRLILDLKNAWLNPNVVREIELKSLAAKKVRVAQFNPSTVRIVIETMAGIKPFHLPGGSKGHRFVIDIGNKEFKEDPALNKPDSDAAKQELERQQREKQELERQEREKQELERQQREKQELERQQREKQELERQQREKQELERQQREKQELERQQREKQELERQQREKQELERQQREKQELERQQREKQELERQQREKQELERQQREKQELERQQREKQELERQQREKQELELKKKQEKELKEKQEREIKEQREREKQLEKERKEREKQLEKERKEREKQLEKERKEREKKEREKKSKEKDKKDSDDDKKEVDRPFKDLDDDLSNITALKGKKIVIDPGHGGNDAGAIGPTGVMEKNVTLNVALELKKLLEVEGAEVIMTRDTDKTVSSKGAAASDIEELGARCEVANRANADIFISIHADSFTRPEARGTTGYYYSKGSGAGQRLADAIRRNLVEQLGTPSRGTQPCNFYVVRHTDMPATLIELGFISNKDEEQLLNSEEGVKKAAQGILDGIEDYFG